MHLELLWTEPLSIRNGLILMSLKSQLELLAMTNTMVFYFSHVADPWNIPSDFLVYFPTRIWFPPPLSPEARAVAFRYFIRVYSLTFSCSYKVTDEELLEISKHPRAKWLDINRNYNSIKNVKLICILYALLIVSLYWNEIRDIVRVAITFVCLSKVDIHKIPSTGFTKSQCRKLSRACVRKVSDIFRNNFLFKLLRILSSFRYSFWTH